MTGTGSSPSNSSANGGGSTSPPRGRKAGTSTNGHRLVGAVGWSVLILLGGLLVFYGWRTGANNQALSQRNLRELDRIARAVEGRTEGFSDGLQGWYEVQKAAQREGTDARAARTASFRRLVPNLLDAPEECDAGHPVAVVSQRRIRFCLALRDTAAVDTTRLWWRGDFSLDSLNRALRSDVFDATFLVDDSIGVFLASSGPAGSIRPRPHGGLAGLRLQDIPADTGRSVAFRVSTVRTVSIAGRDYRLFLQPLDVSPPRGEKADTGATGAASVRWSAGGLVSTSRFRAESLALDTPHLIFLGLLLVLAVLALPFLRAALMGQAESIKTVDVYLLSLSLVLATGILGIAVADIRFFGPFARSLDENLAVASGRVATALRLETRAALDELERWWPAGSPDLRSDTLIFRDLPVSDDRYVHLQMLIWMDSAGMQRAKLTPRASNTALIDVADRDYFRRIRDDRSYIHPDDQGQRYYLESIRSRNTGEKIAMLSAPVCPPMNGASCRDTATLAVKAMTTRLASLDMPLLPPGVRFAVVRGDGVTLFHSDPERNLEENFLEETDDDGRLHALFAAWDSGHVRTSYMGRRSRMHVRPLEGTGTDSLTLVLVLDDGLPGTTHFESIFLSLSGFLAWVIVLLTAFLIVELLLPGRLRWAWPDHERPWKYPALTGLLLCFGGLLVVQAIIAARFRVPVEPGSLLVPVQALSVALLLQSIGLSAPGRVWRNPRIIGWTVFGTAAVLQFGLAVGTPAALPHAWLLRAAQTAMALLAAAAVVTMRRLAHDDQGAVPREPRRRAQKRAAVVLEPWYVATIVATLATTAFLPAFLFHQEALTRQTNRLIQYEQLKLREGMREREHRIRTRTPKLGLVAGYESIIIRDTLDLAVPPVLGATASRTPTRCRKIDADLHARALSAMERRMPFITSAAVEMRHLGPGSGGMRLETCDGGLIHLAGTLPDGAPEDGGDRFRVSAIPGYGPVSGARLLALLGMLIAGAAMAAELARWLGRRVFLLDLPRYAPLNLLSHVTAELTGRTSVIAICKGSMVRSSLEDDPSLRYVDLLDYAGKDCDLNREMESARGQQKLLVLDHFDHRLDDPDWSERLLLALEYHVAVRRARVVLMTSREPCTLFPLLERDGGAERPTTERWVRLLGRFVDVAVADIAAVQAAGSGLRVDADAPNAPDRQREAARLVPAGGAIGSDAGDGTGSTPDAVSTAQAGEEGDPAARRAALGTERDPAGEALGGDPDGRAAAIGTAWAPQAISALLDRASHFSARFVSDAKAASASAKRTLSDESDGRPRLEEVARHVELRSDFHSLTPDAVAEQVRDMADSYYHSLWNILDHDERLVVTQLAYGVVVNPNGRPAVRRLLARRVLVRRPELRLMNESFRRFVREEVPASIIASWERATPASHWQRLRFPLGLGLVAVVAFLFVTQRTAFDSAMALVTAAGVGTTAILKLLGAARWPGRGE